MQEPIDSDREQRFNEIVAAHLDAVESGQAHDWRELQVGYPDFAAEIAEFFMEQADISSQVALLRAAVDNTAEDFQPDLRELGDYLLRREIGRGGMGIVYEAEQKSLGRHVALKVLPWTAMLDRQQLQRFQNEALAAARLHHTNIVPVFEVGCAGNVHYYAMQLIDGQSLAVLLREKDKETRRQGDKETGRQGDKETGRQGDKEIAGISVSRLPDALPEYFRAVARLGIQAAEALEHAHHRGVLHRDIKPANLLLDASGNLWITDFGLAKASSDGELTRTGDIVGTLRYLPPERLRGQSDARSDIYSLGLTLYEMLTHRPAFAATQQDVLIRDVAHTEPVRPRRLDPRIPRDLETIVLKAIAKEPAQRYASALELAEDLRRFLADRPIHARRTTALGHAWRWCRRNPVVATLVGSVAILLLTLIVHARLNARWLAEERNAAVENLRESYLAQAQARRWSGQAGRRFISLDVLSKAAEIRPGIDLRNEAVACMPLVDLRIARKWETGGPDVFDADYERYAHIDAKGNVSIRRLVDDAEIVNLPAQGKPFTGGHFSHDGKYFSVFHDHLVVVWDLAAAKVIVKIERAAGAKHWGGLVFSPDSRQYAVNRGDGFVDVFDLASGKSRGLGGGSGPINLAWHPRGTKLALTRWGDVSIELFDVNSGKRYQTLRHRDVADGDSVNDLAWRPDGHLLAAGHADYGVRVWDLRDVKQPPKVLEGHFSHARMVRFNHRGNLLASCGWDIHIRLWDPVSGKQLVNMPGYFSHFSRDDRRLGYHFADLGREKGILDVALGNECRTLRGNPALGSGPSRVDIHPGGRLAATTHDDGFRLWDLDLGSVIEHRPGVRQSTADFEPDGKHLIVSGDLGIHRWLVHFDQKKGIVKLGPPHSLSPRPSWHHNGAFMNRDGRWLCAAVTPTEIAVFDLQAQAEHVRLKGHRIGYATDICADGQWVVTGTQHGTDVKVWDARTGKLEKNIECGSHGWGKFSFDGRWLVTGSSDGGPHSWEVGSWRTVPSYKKQHGGDGVFSRDGSVAALLQNRKREIALIDVSTGDELATLVAPDALDITGLCFSRDGSRLVACCGYQHALQIWDLRAIREGLAERKLAGSWPAYPASNSAAPVSPLGVELVQK